MSVLCIISVVHCLVGCVVFCGVAVLSVFCRLYGVCPGFVSGMCCVVLVRCGVCCIVCVLGVCVCVCVCCFVFVFINVIVLVSVFVACWCCPVIGGCVGVCVCCVVLLC